MDSLEEPALVSPRAAPRSGAVLFLVVPLLLCFSSPTRAQNARLSFVVGSGFPSRSEKPSEAKLVQIPHPDLNKVEAAVKEQIEAAQSELQSSLQKADTDPSQLAKLYGNLGKLYHAYDFPDAAVACYINAHTLAPQEFVWVYYLGHVRLEKADNQGAIGSLREAVQIRPDEIVAQLNLAQAYLDENHPELAKPLFERALALDKKSAAAMAGLGKIALAAGNFLEAVRYLEAVLAAQPGASSMHYPLALAYRQMGDMPKALAHLQKRGLNKAKVPDPYMDELDELKKGRMFFWLRGNEAMHERRFRDAVDAYGKMVASNDQDPLAKIALGSALAQTGDFGGATEQYTRALSLAPHNDIAHYNLGLLLIQKNAEREAIEHFQAAVDSNPGSKMAHFQLANLLMRNRRYEAALGHYSKMIQLDPSHEFARLMEALVLVRLKRYREAKTRLQEDLAALPESTDLAEALARLLAACPDKEVRDGPRALKLVQTVLATQKSPDLEVIECLAMALAEVGRFSQAARIQGRMIAELERSNRHDLAVIEQANLALYEREQPCRTPWRDDDPIFSPQPGKMELVVPKEL